MEFIATCDEQLGTLLTGEASDEVDAKIERARHKLQLAHRMLSADGAQGQMLGLK